MAEGFRKAFLGFNCNDVIEYIKKTHAEFSEKEEELKLKIKELESELSAEKQTSDELREQLSAANAVIEQYKEKEEEINRISENIGKLYIVSQANARAVTETAEENRRLAQMEVNKNLNALKAAHEELSAIIKGVTETSVDFTDNMKSLSGDLDTTIETINQNNIKSDDSLKETQKVLSPAE